MSCCPKSTVSSSAARSASPPVARPDPGAVPDRALGRSRPRARPRNRRRRLHDQAVQPARADRPRQSPPAPRGAGRRARALVEIGPFRLDRTARRVFLRGRRTGADLHRVQPAGVLPDAPRPRLQPRPAAGSRLGRAALCHAAHRGRPRPPPARAIEEQPDSPRYLTTVRGFGYRFEEAT